jgi:Tol biopolymer transport system component
MGRIMFLRQGGKYGDATVFTANASGSHQQRITGYGQVCCPRWSANGSSSILWGNEFHRPDGKLIRKVPLPRRPRGMNLVPQAISPTTGRLACEGWDDNKPSLNGIYTIRASDGGGLVRVTHQHDVPADFSPDGSKIFFLGSDGQSLHVVNTDGTDQRRVTPPGLAVDAPNYGGGRLSPDGHWIVFTSFGTMWVIHPDGSGLSKIFEDTQGRLAVTPTWSPDGNYILFALDPPGSQPTVNEAPTNGLYVIRADGSGLTPVLISNDFKTVRDWVPA